MNKNNIEKEFYVGNPTKENIEYAFKNLLYYLTASTYLDIYCDKKKDFELILDKVKNILVKYINCGNLSVINEKELEYIKFDLIDIDTETKILNSYYAEWSLLWFEAIISLRKSEIKMKGEK